ncbi:dTMP kinase [Ligilactobacillus sp.]|uniref:dTMP kinase n=1 Tax=Ligilactobacillus sp. TaxID=2767921 RepID=UPI002FE357CF
MFITFEGTDGSGKTSVIKAMVRELEEKGRNGCVLTREPGGNRISEAIRNVILDERFTEMDERTEALLYAAARRQHIVETINPALSAGKLVLCDRFVDSSIVYQGAGRSVGTDEIAEMNRFATDGLTPDLTIFLDIDPELGLERIRKNRQDEVNRLDHEKMSFYQTVHDAYLKLAAGDSRRIVTVDASRPLEEVILEVKGILKKHAPEFFA